MKGTDVVTLPVSPEAERRKLLGRLTYDGEGDINCFVYVPKTLCSDSRIFVAVHGIARNPFHQLACFVPIAEQNEAVLIVPLLDEATWRRYQRLMGSDKVTRADAALIRAIDRISSKLGVYRNKIHLFGYSGGAQFAHRFTFVHPERVEALAMSSAGWYTFPDSKAKFPLGLRNGGILTDGPIDIRAIVEVRYLALVGEDDVKIDKNLNMGRRICNVQGITRVERAAKWVEAMNRCAQAQGRGRIAELCQLPGLGHYFRDVMIEGQLGKRVGEFLFAA